MENKDILFILKNRKKTVVLITLLFLFLVLIITFVQPFKYRATTKILVSQSYGPASDAYSVSKSNQFISNVLAQIIYSDLFFEDVLKAGYNIDQNYFPADVSRRKKEWQKTVEPVVLNDAGVIIINTYHPDKYQASQINQAIAYTLKANHAQYHGLGNKITVKVIDRSVASRFPVKPNLILNALFGIFSGLIFGLAYVYIFPEERSKSMGQNHSHYHAPSVPANNEKREEKEAGKERDHDDFSGNIKNIYHY